MAQPACPSPFLWPANLRMRTAIAGVFILSCLLSGKLKEESNRGQLVKKMKSYNMLEWSGLKRGDWGSVLVEAAGLLLPLNLLLG